MQGGRVAAVLLAAGESSRMGRPKALLPWMGTTLVAYQVGQLRLAGADPVVVVLGHQEERVAAAVGDPAGVIPVANPAFRQGKSTSIRLGVEALPEDVDAILLLAVDQPRRAETLRLLIAAHLEGSRVITAPAYRGRRGHPPVLSSTLRWELVSLSEGQRGLREVMHRHLSDTLEVPLETPEVLFDLNTPEQYREALAWFAG